MSGTQPKTIAAAELTFIGKVTEQIDAEYKKQADAFKSLLEHKMMSQHEHNRKMSELDKKHAQDKLAAYREAQVLLNEEKKNNENNPAYKLAENATNSQALSDAYGEVSNPDTSVQIKGALKDKLMSMEDNLGPETEKMVAGFESIGDAIAGGEDAAKSFSAAALRMSASVLRAIAKELAGRAAVAAVCGDAAKAAMALAAATVASIGAGYLENRAKNEERLFDENKKSKKNNNKAEQVDTTANKEPKAYANGGIVGGISYTGDNVLARVNSGELILNEAQQGNIANKLTQPGSSVAGGDFKVIINNNANVDVRQEPNFDLNLLHVFIENKVLQTMGSRRGASVMQTNYGLNQLGVQRG